MNHSTIIKLHLLALVCLFSCLYSNAQGTFPEGFGFQVVQQGLNPVAMTVDHHGRVWLLEKDGRVLILDEDGTLLPEPFVQLFVDDYNERGLLGIALHPDMDNHPYVYLYYSVRDENHNRVSRFTANGDVALPGSELVLLELDQLAGAIHNGGAMQFGPDGMLYIATGEGALPQSAQNLNSLLGKVLRIEPDGRIPEDNPFYATLAGKYRSIWAYGLRNPFSMTFDHTNGRVFVCDVGQGDFEEINEILPGRNYGWPLEEGMWAQSAERPANYQDPFYAYSHNDGCAIVGAAFYRSHIPQFPEAYVGKFFFADYCEGYIHVLNPDNGQVEGVFASNVERPLAFAVNEENGDLYMLSRAGIGGGSPVDNTSTEAGSLWKIFFSGNGSPFIAVHPSPVFLPEGEDAFFSIQALGAGNLSYQWQKNGVDITGANSRTLQYPSVHASDNESTFRCIVANEVGRDTSEVALLSVTTNRRPEVFITSPVLGETFKAGDTIHFSGWANDPEEGLIATDKLCWKIDLHHNEHNHPLLHQVCGITEGTFVIPKVTETDTNIWLRVYLTAEDNVGLKRSTYQEVFPEYTSIYLDGPHGLSINIDGKIRTLPYRFSSLKNLQHAIQVPFTQQVGDSLYVFRQWRDGHDALLKTFFAAEGSLSHGLIYDAFNFGNGEGLLGQYYTEMNLAEENFSFERIDTTIHFEWDQGTPMPDNRVDFFSIRWTGEVQAVLTEEYTFYTRSDDGVRLWINDQLIIDKWVPQAATEHKGTFFMEAGKRYPIRMEYFEQGGGATASLSWSSARTSKQIIPKQQLFLPAAERIAMRGKVWLDVDGNGQFDLGESALDKVSVLVYQAQNAHLVASTQSNDKGEWLIADLAAGTYQLQFIPDIKHQNLLPAGELDGAGISPIFEIEAGEELVFDASFIAPELLRGVGLKSTQIFPNPGQNQLNMQLVTGFKGSLTVALFDVSGRQLAQRQFELQRGMNRMVWDMSSYQKGVYWLRFSDGNSVLNKKWVKGG
ncbi:MAG: PQQ-dependent sugar dehydrogenase [Saprospiraceae bacterium]